MGFLAPGYRMLYPSMCLHRQVILSSTYLPAHDLRNYKLTMLCQLADETECLVGVGQQRRGVIRCTYMLTYPQAQG